MVFKSLVMAVDTLFLVLGVYLGYLAMTGKRASTGLKPRSHQLPLLPVRVLFILGSIYAVAWSSIHLGFDFGLLSKNSKPFLLLDAFNRSIGAGFIEIFLLIWFAIFGWSMARLCFAPGITLPARFFAALGFALSTGVVLCNCYLLIRLIK
jgi:hypothetical protein